MSFYYHISSKQLPFYCIKKLELPFSKGYFLQVLIGIFEVVVHFIFYDSRNQMIFGCTSKDYYVVIIYFYSSDESGSSSFECMSHWPN